MPRDADHTYAAPWWLPGAHTQTVWPALFGHAPTINYQREHWDSTPHGVADGDWIAVDRITGSPFQPQLLVFHGLEGSSQSVYSRQLMYAAQARGWRGLVAHFRGCGGLPNRLPRAYHSGDAAEIDWIVRRAKAEAPGQALYIAAVSLGGNATLKWLGEQGAAAVDAVDGVVAISAPFDLAAAGNALEQGFCQVYARNFLRSMKRTALQKLTRFPGLYRAEVVRQATTLRAFDNEVTAPLHGYRDTDDYWQRASAKPGLTNIQVATLLLNARNDPFLPAWALPLPNEVSASVTLDFPEEGGHVGLMSSPFPGDGGWMARRTMRFFLDGH